jgi:hypothetical protein
VTGSSIAVTGSIAADGPAMVLASLSVLYALRYRRDPSTGRAVVIGVALGAAIMVKALVLPAALPVGLILLWGRRPKDWVAAVGSAVLVGLGLSLLWGFGDVWDQSVVYHLEAPGGSEPGANLKKLISTVTTRDVVLVATGVLAAVAALSSRWRAQRGEAHPDQGTGPPVGVLLWTWFASMALMLVMEHPMWRPHISELVPPACLLLAWYRPPVKATLVVAIVATVFMTVTYAGPSLLWAGGYDGDEAVVVDTLRGLPDGALAISDEPGQVWRSGLRTPDDLVDGSALLTDSGRSPPTPSPTPRPTRRSARSSSGPTASASSTTSPTCSRPRASRSPSASTSPGCCTSSPTVRRSTGTNRGTEGGGTPRGTVRPDACPRQCRSSSRVTSGASISAFQGGSSVRRTR